MKVYRPLYTLPFLILSQLALAGSIIVEGGRVKGLHYSENAPNQRATFELSTDFQFPVGTYAVGIQWRIDDMVIQTGGPITYAATYVAALPGKHNVTCTASWIDPNPGGGGRSETMSTTIAAIGGPLNYSVLGSQDGVTVPEHDSSNPLLPFHIQYFGYDPVQGLPDANTQASQYGVTAVALDQLVGTTYEWRKSGPVKAWPGTGEIDDDVYVAIPTSGCPSGGIKLRVTYHYTDPYDPTLTGSADDDSEETPPPGQTSPNAAYYSYTSHRPKYAVKTDRFSLEHVRGGVWPDTDPWTYQDAFMHQIKDGAGEGIAGVWVIEKFPYYESEIAVYYLETGLYYSLRSAQEGGQWTSLLADSFNPEGTLSGADSIGLQDIKATQQNPDPSQYLPFSCTQQFFAASRSPSITAYGLLVKTWTNTVTPVSVSHAASN